MSDPRASQRRIWTGDLELHVTCDVAYAIWQYWQVSGDDEFMRDFGAQIVLEIARFWESRVEEDSEHPGRFVLTDVVGPDEYHEHADNNVFTNRMVAWHLRTALQVLSWLKQAAYSQAKVLIERLELTSKRLRLWQEIADVLVILYDPQTGLFEQFEGFFELPDVDWQAYENRTKAIQAVLGIEETNQRLPAGWQRLAFNFYHRGRRCEVDLLRDY